MTWSADGDEAEAEQKDALILAAGTPARTASLLGGSVAGDDAEDGGAPPQSPAGGCTSKKAKKGKNKKGWIPCRGCLKKFDADSCTTATDFCPDFCKRACDRLRDVARTEGAASVAWLATQLQSTVTAVPLITAYYDKVGRPSAGARKQRGGPRFSLVEYKETIKASSYIDVYSQGRMMWKRQYVEWAQTLDGGKKTEKHAEAQWNEWVIMHAADANSVIADTAGPMEAPLQFRVETVKCVDIGNKYSHDKSLEAIQRAKKTATPEEGREGEGGAGQANL